MIDEGAKVNKQIAWTGAVLSARGDEQSAAHAAELAGLLATMLREYPWADALLSER